MPTLDVKDKSMAEAVTCDDIGCVGKLADGTLVALPFNAEAFEEDCRAAALVVSQRTAPPSCAAVTIDRTVWPRTGATALYRRGGVWERVVSYPPGYDRPWAKAMPRGEGTDLPATASRAPARDATPRAEDLGADD